VSAEPVDIAAPPDTTTVILVVVGTDVHPFDRVVQWTDAWLARQDPVPAAVVQYGFSASPSVASGDSLIPHERLQVLMQAAAVVVTHGGPATIMEVRRHGRRPVVVPRDPGRGEHVDGHQLLFSDRLDALGLITRCATFDEFCRALDAAAADPATFLLGDGGAEQAVADEARRAAVGRVGRILDELIAGGSRRQVRRRTLRRRRFRRPR
jgi:UDP-N-acetylglucosamine transferase subunit ALG13